MTKDQLIAREAKRIDRQSRFFVGHIPRGIGMDSTDAEIEAAFDRDRMNRELDESLSLLAAIPGASK